MPTSAFQPNKKQRRRYAKPAAIGTVRVRDGVGDDDEAEGEETLGIRGCDADLLLDLFG
jgi:hypothetical protein